MESLVFKSEKGTPVTNSLLVAEKFGKRHDNVVRSIQDLMAQMPDGGALNFVETPYIHPQNGQTYNMYIMNRDGFSLLVMGFTGKDALKFKLEYIKAFNKMEEAIKSLQTPKTYAAALRQLADEVEQKEKAQMLLEEKTQQLDESKEWYSIKRYAKEHGINWRKISWRALKALSCENGYEVQKIFDANYGEVNLYHKNAFKLLYNQI